MAEPTVTVTRWSAMVACSPLADARDRKLQQAYWAAWATVHGGVTTTATGSPSLTAQIAKIHAQDAAMYEAARREMAEAWKR